MQRNVRFSRSIVVVVLLIFQVTVCRAANWYLAQEATGGANNGTSWTDAWRAFSNINWSLIQPGDTVWLSGGPAGGTNTYIGNIDDNGMSRNNGTPGNPITLKVARDSAHNGLFKMIGYINLNATYRVLDGSKSDWTPGSVMDTYRIGTNCNWEVYATNSALSYSAVTLYGATGSKCMWIHVSAAGLQPVGGGVDMYGITMPGQSGVPIGNGSEIAYNWIGDVYGFGIYACESGNFVSNTFGQVKIHHNLIEGAHDNTTQIANCADVYKNVGRYRPSPQVGHPDTQQDCAAWFRSWNNIWYDSEGSCFYVEANTTLSHDILCYNNLFYSRTNPWTSGFRVTGHDAELGQVCNLSNIWIFNNTWYDVGTSQTIPVFDWNRGNRPESSVSNLWFMNNAIILQPPNNIYPVLNFPTNFNVVNQIYGFDYRWSDVRVDYNSIGGGSGGGKGIVYGIHGTEGVDQYPDMASFGADTGYTHNNNSTATYVSLTNYDFRLGADTALKGLGTNLIALLTNIAPDCGSDILGNVRPLTGAWDIGAYQCDRSLIFWLSANNHQFQDDSGSGYTPYQGNPTNQVYFTNGVDGLGMYWITNGAHPTGGAGNLGCYLYVTNIAGVYLTNATISFWAQSSPASYVESYIMDAGYDAIYASNPSAASNSFAIKRSNSLPGSPDQYSFLLYYVVTPGSVGYSNVVQWPVDDVGGGNYGTAAPHLYTVTVNCANHTAITYYDGQPYMTNSLNPNIPAIRVYNYLCLGAWHHDNSPIWNGTYPNAGYYAGMMDDVRIYNRTLSAPEVTGLLNGAGASTQSQPGNPNPPPSLTFAAAPTTINAGQSSTLTWTSSNATNATLSGLGSVAVNGNTSVTPSTTTTYTLTVTGPGGTQSANATVTVVPISPLPSVSLTASPGTIVSGQSATLTWTSLNATNVSVSGFGQVALNGNLSVSPTETMTYTATAQGPGGTATSSATVTVTPTQPNGLTFLATAGTISSPFIVTNGYIYQTFETDNPTNGGRAAYTFVVTNAGSYGIQMLVNAPGDAANSLFLNVDGEPQDPNMIWDMPITTGFQSLMAAWRGNGTFDNDEFVPVFFTLSAGTHTLIIRGREANVQVQSISFIGRPAPPGGLTVIGP